MRLENDIVDSGRPLLHITNVEYLGGHKLHLWFNDGVDGIVDLSDLPKREMFKGLQDPKKFIQFGLEFGTLVWSDDLDVAPEFLHDRALKKQ